MQKGPVSSNGRNRMFQLKTTPSHPKIKLKFHSSVLIPSSCQSQGKPGHVPTAESNNMQSCESGRPAHPTWPQILFKTEGRLFQETLEVSFKNWRSSKPRKQAIQEGCHPRLVRSASLCVEWITHRKEHFCYQMKRCEGLKEAERSLNSGWIYVVWMGNVLLIWNTYSLWLSIMVSLS